MQDIEGGSGKAFEALLLKEREAQNEQTSHQIFIQEFELFDVLVHEKQKSSSR
jgi:hypothetical protein